MRYAIFGLLVFVVGCQMTPEQKAAWDLGFCQSSIVQSSYGPGRTPVSYAEAERWCRAMDRGQPYTPVTNSAPIVRVQPAPAPRYVCDDWTGQVRCRPE